MTIQELYDDMKGALDYFGLQWGDKDKVTVEVEGQRIRFIYGTKDITVTVK